MKNNKEKDNRKRKILIIILLLLFLFLCFGITFGRGIYESITDQILEITGVNRIGAPKISAGNEIWQKEVLVSITDNANSNKKIDYYEYCISTDKSTKDCEWQKTYTKNAVISVSGKYYVTFRAVADNGQVGKNSNQVVVWVDNNNPIINKIIEKTITENSISVEVDAKDNESGISKYLYSLDGKNYTEGNLHYTFNNLTNDTNYLVYVKVLDKLDNATVVALNMKTKESGQEKQLDEKEDIIDDNNEQDDENQGESETQPEPNPKDEPTEPTTPEEPEVVWDIPIVSLENVPSRFTYGDKYDLPTSYDFGNDDGVVECRVDGAIYSDTSLIYPGKRTIECKATSNHDKVAIVEKDIEIALTEGLDEIFDGWVKLNLFYPDNSINWEWRLGNDNSIRTGYNDDGWQPYTGPILVKLEDVSNVYIRYEMTKETYIIPPNGKLIVDIEPINYSLSEGQTTEVIITYDKNAETKEYQINDGDWQEYTGPFEVGPDSLISARSTKEEKVYNNLGEYQYSKTLKANDSVYISVIGIPSTTSGGSSYQEVSANGWIPSGPGSVPYLPGSSSLVVPPEYLEGPIIQISPDGVSEKVTVTIIAQQEADVVYYSIGGGKYNRYTQPFDVTENCVIRAYYIRKYDGKQSRTSARYVDNIKQPQLPYVKITASPSKFLTEAVDKVDVTISGSNYDKLEYSFDGIFYEPYTIPLEIFQSTTIYAKGTNVNGETIESLAITTNIPAKEKEKLDIMIEVDPKKEDVVGLINEAEVTINYDTKATKKYYKLSSFYSWQEYTGPFKITENTTIYAYAASSDGIGFEELSVDYLTTGISSPLIRGDFRTPAQSIPIEITYSKTADVTKYKIGNGEWQEYTGKFYVEENTTITAYNKDALGNEAYSSKNINNIITESQYQLIDKGDYFIIKLNYPSVSDVNSRGYKWKLNGAWKIYNPQGVLLIKPQGAQKLLNNTSILGVEVEDENGKKIRFTDHYYIVDVPLTEIFENIFMRWDNETPSAPIINLDSEDATKEISVNINYGDTIKQKYYRVVLEDGTDTGWLPYTDSFKLNQNNAVIYAKGINSIGIESKIASKKIVNIDEVVPTITIKADFTSPKQQVSVTVSANDDVELDLVKYAEGSHDAEYFIDNGQEINNNTAVSLSNNGIYTFYAKDKVGNAVIKELEVTNIDKNAPDVVITDKTTNYGITANVEISYGDSSVKEYSIGNNTNYQQYTGELVINSKDVYQFANADGSLTIYARGKDKAGNINEVSESIYTLDLDMPASPIINANAGYPVLTENGVVFDDILTVAYDNRNDITNYIDIGDGSGWKIYTGLEHVSSGTVKAKSVKKISGLTNEVTREIETPTDSLPFIAYDGLENEKLNSGTYYLMIDESMRGKYLWFVHYNYVNTLNQINIYQYDENNNQLSSNRYGYTNGTNTIRTEYTVLLNENTVKVKIQLNGYSNLLEVGKSIINASGNYPVLTPYGVDAHNEIELDYQSNSSEKWYQIQKNGIAFDNSKWLKYQDGIINKLDVGETIYVKSVDYRGKESVVQSFSAIVPTDAIEFNAYDGDLLSRGMQKGIMYIDESMYDKEMRLLTSFNCNGCGQRTQSIYFKLKNGEEIIKQYIAYPGSANYSNVLIPDGALYFELKNDSDGFNLYEVEPYTGPNITVEKVYPKIAEYGVDSWYNNVSISYFPTAVRRLYQIVANGDVLSDNNWLEYEDKNIKLKSNETIYAKSIDIYGKSSLQVFETSEMPTNAIESNAYDGDILSRTKQKGIMYIDESMYDKEMKLLASFNCNGCSQRTQSIYFKLKNGEEIIKQYIAYPGSANYSNVLIPNGALYFELKNDSDGFNLYEVEPVNTIMPAKPKLNLNRDFGAPKIDATGDTYSKQVSILYSGNYINQYSLDLGETWLEYIEPFMINENKTIFARTIDDIGNIVSSSSLQITTINVVNDSQEEGDGNE